MGSSYVIQVTVAVGVSERVEGQERVVEYLFGVIFWSLPCAKC
jgi:hypothetical protein